jgi:hypothetical protein
MLEQEYGIPSPANYRVRQNNDPLPLTVFLVQIMCACVRIEIMIVLSDVLAICEMGTTEGNVAFLQSKIPPCAEKRNHFPHSLGTFTEASVK